MKKRVSLIVVSILLAIGLAGCGVVTVVPIGQESSFTGKEEFDSGAQSSDDWSAVVEDIKGKAADISEALAGGGDGAAVSGSAKIIEFNTDTPKYYLLVEMDGYSGGEIRIQAGGVYSGTAVRDAQGVKGFEDFANQTEWSQYAKALNQEADTQVVAPLAIDESVAGKTVTFTGAAAESGGTVTITPVEMTIE
ncbi:MAG: DUF2291 domain-containing protein [Lachnospiraceae bacterium]|jgi:predicted lipoprotein|nr:DUF2291 domain-containing protein [Lachnospiraceae bacterium]